MTEKDLFCLLESWDNFNLILLQLENQPEDISDLMKFALYNNHSNSWRAIYLADKIHEKQPDLIQPYIEEIIEQLKSEKHHGKRRHFLKLVSLNHVSAQHFGFLVDHCITTFTSAKEPIANRVHAMQILYNISDAEPELKPELLEIIQHEIEFHPTPGIRSRGTKLAKKLQKQINKN